MLKDIDAGSNPVTGATFEDNVMNDFNQEKNIILDKAHVYVGKNLGQLPAELLSYLNSGGKDVHMKELEAILADLGIGWVQAARIAEDLIKEAALKYTATHLGQ